MAKKIISMKFKRFDIVVGTAACIAKCPFCVSCEKINKENMLEPEINYRNLDIACNLASKNGIDTITLTSYGEPLLFPEQITKYLENIKKFNFPFIELQTNGILFLKEKEKFKKYLIEWYNLGLTHIAISTIHYKNEINGLNYFGDETKYIDLVELAKHLHEYGFSLRYVCVLSNKYISNVDEIFEYIRFAKENKIEQLTIRPLNLEYRRKDAYDWTHQYKLLNVQIEDIYDALYENGTKIITLDSIGEIFDINGQNVCFSAPLNKNIRNKNEDNIRNLIFTSDGHIRYEWEMPGAILL